MATFSTRDDVTIYYKDWGPRDGEVVILSHGWPLRVRSVLLFGFSTGGGEVARYVGRHGTSRVARLGLISAVPPLMLRTEANPEGLAIGVFDGLRAASIADRSKL